MKKQRKTLNCSLKNYYFNEFYISGYSNDSPVYYNRVSLLNAICFRILFISLCYIIMMYKIMDDRDVYLIISGIANLIKRITYTYI